MDPAPKRRARFKKGFTPPPLETQPLSEFQQYLKRSAERKERLEERKRNRLPLPEDSVILERFTESTLRYFALSKPGFWEDSLRRFFCYPSDFLGKLRLGQHLDSCDRIVSLCRKAKFPAFQHGKVEMDFPARDGNRRGTPQIFYRLSETAEWTEAQAELRASLGIQEGSFPPSSNAQKLIDFAAKIPLGTTATFSDKCLSSWSHFDHASAVGEAQTVDSRLFLEDKGYFNSKIIVGKQPLPWLVLPSLDACLDLPLKPTKAECDAASKKIEQIVEREYQGQSLSSQWLVLVRTKSRRQALKSFGHLDSSALAKVASKLRPVRMRTWWSFASETASWILAVRPEGALQWPQVVEALHEKANEQPSRQKYGLSREAAALFDWLHCLPHENFEWGLSPEVTDEILETEIGIENPWAGENGFLFFHLLAAEISRQTPFVAVAHPWTHYSTPGARIEFRQKDDGPTEATRANATSPNEKFEPSVPKQ